MGMDFLRSLIPLPTEGIKSPKSSSKSQDTEKMKYMIAHAAKAGIGWGGIMFATRMLLDAKGSKEEKELNKTLKAYSNARYPVLSPDASTRDPVREEEERNLGLDKNSADMLDTAAQALQRVYTAFAREDTHPLHIATVVASAIGGSMVGYKLADKLMDRKNNLKADSDIANYRNDLDAEMLQEYNRTRGITKESAKKGKKVETSFMKGIGSLYPLYFAALLATTYSASKKFSDSKDKNRQKLKQIEQVMRERAVSDEAPLLQPTAVPESMKGYGIQEKKKKTLGSAKLV